MVQRTRPIRSPRRPPIPEAIARRTPPGQFATHRWPILHQGDVPAFDPDAWDFRMWGLVNRPASLSWAEMQALPMVTLPGDLHCVTRWSTLDHTWTGIRPATLCERVDVDAAARFVILHGEGDYTANLPLDVFLAEDVLLATGHNGEPLAPEHGAPLRVVAPEVYAWKSVKWLRGIEFVAEDRPGYWEAYGYSNTANVWREERFES